MRTNYPEDFKNPTPASVDYEQLLHDRAESEEWRLENLCWLKEFDAMFLEADPQSGLLCYTQHPNVLKNWIHSLIEEIIDEIPADEHAEFCKARGSQYKPCGMCVKERLREKYLLDSKATPSSR